MKWQQIVYICCMTCTFLFSTFVMIYADNLKSPAEILLQARQLEANESPDSKYFYITLVENYPKSKEAATARQRLAALEMAEKQKKAAALKREAAEREEARRQEEYRQAHQCDHLYVGKVVQAPVTGLVNMFGIKSEQAIVIGISNRHGVATVKSTSNSSMIGELSCSQLK